MSQDTTATMTAVMERINALGEQLTLRINDIEKNLTSQIASVEKRINTLETNLSIRLDRIDSMAHMTRADLLGLRADFNEFRDSLDNDNSDNDTDTEPLVRIPVVDVSRQAGKRSRRDRK